jgi:transposase
MEKMKRTRRKFSSEFKSQVAIGALKERYTLTELAQKFELHPNQISQWKQEFLERSKSIFETENSRKTDQPEVDLEKLYGKIGRLEMERDFLKKSLNKLGHSI